MSQEPVLYGSAETLERDICHRLKDIRLNRNLTQQALAKTAGISRRTVSSVENGEGCTLVTLIRILQALNHTHLLTQLVEPLPMHPLEQHRNVVREPRQRASSPRKAPDPGAWKWGDETD